MRASHHIKRLNIVVGSFTLMTTTIPRSAGIFVCPPRRLIHETKYTYIIVANNRMKILNRTSLLNYKRDQNNSSVVRHLVLSKPKALIRNLGKTHQAMTNPYSLYLRGK